MSALNELVAKTEKAVETAFLWLRILKALKGGPRNASELRRALNPMPHRFTFETNLFLMARLGLVERKERKWYITEQGIMVLNRATEHLKRQMMMLLGP